MISVERSVLFENVQHHAQIPPEIVHGIIMCVRSAFEGGVTDEDTLHHIQGDVVSVHITTGGEVAAFSSTVIGSPKDILKLAEAPSEQGCYLAGATVAKEHQSTGLYKKMNQERIDLAVARRLPLVFTRTQNPRVQAGVESVLQSKQAEGVLSGFSLQKIKIPGYYGSMLTKTKPTHHGIEYTDLDYDAGDAYALIYTLVYSPTESSHEI